jgi:DNA-binding response OmpR family regulator
VFLTAIDDFYAQRFGEKMGGAAYITKPVDFNELERILLNKLGE